MTTPVNPATAPASPEHTTPTSEHNRTAQHLRHGESQLTLAVPHVAARPDWVGHAAAASFTHWSAGDHPDRAGALTIGDVRDPGQPAPDQVTAAPEQVTAAPEQVTAAPDQVTAAPDQVTAAPDQVTAALEQVTAAPAALTAVITDWGGVLTNPILDTVRAWIELERIDFASYATVMRAWVSGAYAAGGQDNPIHALERGECSNAEFELAAGRPARPPDGTPVAAEGLLDRMFAATALCEPMLDLVLGVRPGRAAHRACCPTPGARTPTRPTCFPVCSTQSSSPPRWACASRRSGSSGTRRRCLGSPRRACVFIDDIEANVRAAEAIGMTGVVHVEPGPDRGPRARAAGLAGPLTRRAGLLLTRWAGLLLTRWAGLP